MGAVVDGHFEVQRCLADNAGRDGLTYWALIRWRSLWSTPCEEQHTWVKSPYGWRRSFWVMVIRFKACYRATNLYRIDLTSGNKWLSHGTLRKDIYLVRSCRVQRVVPFPKGGSKHRHQRPSQRWDGSPNHRRCGHYVYHHGACRSRDRSKGSRREDYGEEDSGFKILLGRHQTRAVSPL
jgi:hypothetical protein